jgi:transcriptional regulator with XRE-family HTH domain
LQPLDAERVKVWRHRRMLSQQEVADCAGTSLFTIQRIERGEGNVRPKTGRGVANALGIPIEELLPKVQAPLFQELLEQETPEERRADVKGFGEGVRETPQYRPGSKEQLPESAGHHIRVEIRDELSTEPARVTITRTAFLDMLRRYGLAERAAEEVIEELQKTA